MDSDNEEILPSINSDPVNLINQMTYPTQSPLASMTKAFSRSVPNSRRNSSDDHIDLLLNSKLSLNEPYDRYMTLIITRFFTYIKIRRKSSLAQELTNGLETNMGLHDTVQSNTEGIERKKKDKISLILIHYVQVLLSSSIILRYQSIRQQLKT